MIATIGRVPGQNDLAVRLQDRRFGAPDDTGQRNAVPTPEAGIQRAIGVVASQAEVIAAAAVAVPGDEDLAVRLEKGFLAELPSRPEAGRGLPVPHAERRRIVHRRHTHVDGIGRTREGRGAAIACRADFGPRRPARLVPRAERQRARACAVVISTRRKIQPRARIVR